MTDLGLTALVGAAKKVQKARVKLFIAAARPRGHPQSLGTILIFECLQFGGNLIQSLIPGDLLPLVFAFFTDSFERIIQTIGMIKTLQVWSPFARAFLDRRCADLDNLVVFHLELQAATRFASKTDGMLDFFGHFSKPPFFLNLA